MSCGSIASFAAGIVRRQLPRHPRCAIVHFLDGSGMSVSDATHEAGILFSSMHPTRAAAHAHRSHRNVMHVQVLAALDRYWTSLLAHVLHEGRASSPSAQGRQLPHSFLPFLSAAYAAHGFAQPGSTTPAASVTSASLPHAEPSAMDAGMFAARAISQLIRKIQKLGCSRGLLMMQLYATGKQGRSSARNQLCRKLFQPALDLFICLQRGCNTVVDVIYMIGQPESQIESSIQHASVPAPCLR